MPEVGLLSLLLACTPDPPAVDSAVAPAEPTVCGTGLVWDGGACVAERCGVAPFPDGPEGAVYVDASASGGDGTEGSPFATLAEGLAAAGAGGTVLVAAGTYRENLAFTDALAGVEVRGRCPELVAVDGTDLDPETPLVYTLGGPGRRWTLGGFEVKNARYAGIWALDGTLVLDTMDVHDNALLGLGVGDSDGASLEATGIHVHDNLPLDRQGGYGLYVVGGARAVVQDAVIAGNPRVNVVAHEPNTDLTLTDVEVRDAVSVSTQTVGIDVDDGATLVGTRLSVVENAGISVDVSGGSHLVLSSSEIRGTRDPNGEGGLALLVTDGSRFEADDLSVVDADAGGIQLDGAEVDVTGLRIEDIRVGSDPRGGVALDLVDVEGTLRDVSVSGAAGGGVQVFGGRPRFEGLTVTGSADPTRVARGLQVSEGAEAEFVDLSLTDNTDAGIAVYGSTLTITGGSVVGTVPQGSVGGTGIYAEDGAVLWLADVALTDNRYVALLLSGAGTEAHLDGVEVGLTRSDRTFVFGRGAEVHDFATLDAVDSHFSGNQEIGVYVGGGGDVTLDHVTIEGTVPSATYTTGFGIVVQGASHASLDSVVLQANTGPGLYAVAGGEIEAFETTVLGNGFAGGVVWDGSLEARDCDFTGSVEDPSLGGGVGVFGVGSAGSVVVLEDVIVSGNRYAGFWADGEGSWVLRDVDLMGGGGVSRGDVRLHGNALFARAGAVVSVEGGWLRHSQTAVLLDGATATVEGAVFEDNRLDVRQQGCGAVAPVSAPDAVTVDLCPEVEELVAPLDFRVDVGEVAVEP